MTTRKKYLIIITSSTLIALIIGIIGSYHYVKYIYLREQIETNINALNLQEWYKQENFIPPADNIISEQQLLTFFKVNHELGYLLDRVLQKLENNNWMIAFEVIKMQPEWLSAKYLALKKHSMVPGEYDWIVSQVIRFWLFRWRENSLEKLKTSGWTPENMTFGKKEKPVNYFLFMVYEDDLNLVFELLWPEQSTRDFIQTDSLNP